MIDDLVKAIKTLSRAENLQDVGQVLKDEWARFQELNTPGGGEEAVPDEPEPQRAAKRTTMLTGARGLVMAGPKRAVHDAAVLERKLLGRDKMDSADVAAAAWLAGHRGDIAAARVLCELVPGWEKTPSSEAISAARDWQALEAAARCDWGAVEAVGGDTPTLRALKEIAARRPELAGLKAALKRVRADRDADPVIGRALTAAVATTRRRLVTVVPQARSQAPMAKATALHMAVLGRPAETVTARLLARVARSWDRVLADPKTERSLRQRAAVLAAGGPGGADVKETLGAVRATVVEDLVGVVVAAELPIDELAAESELLQEVLDALDIRLADELGAAVVAMERRKEKGERLPTLECLREWVALRVAYERHARILGLGGRMAAFELVYKAMASQAANLWNEHGLRRLPNAMFGWMAAEAERVGRSDAAHLQTGNKSW